MAGSSLLRPGNIIIHAQNPVYAVSVTITEPVGFGEGKRVVFESIESGELEDGRAVRPQKFSRGSGDWKDFGTS